MNNGTCKYELLGYAVNQHRLMAESVDRGNTSQVGSGFRLLEIREAFVNLPESMLGMPTPP